jgi:hypothetical protein
MQILMLAFILEICFILLPFKAGYSVCTVLEKFGKKKLIGKFSGSDNMIVSFNITNLWIFPSKCESALISHMNKWLGYE